MNTDNTPLSPGSYKSNDAFDIYARTEYPFESKDVKQEIAKMQVREDKVDELRVWRDRLDEIVSPSQLRELILSVDKLKIFRTKAITIFAVVQFGMAAILWLSNVT